MSEASRWEVRRGYCLDVMRGLEPGSVDSVVCDPPYALTAKKKGGSGVASVNLDSPYGRARVTTGNGAGGFMGQAWDAALPGPEVWAECLRVAKPGAHLLAFGGTRTFHRLACAIEDAGWEIRDGIGWLYDLADEIRARCDSLTDAERIGAELFLLSLPSGPFTWVFGSGFPKSHNGPWGGTALKPAHEPIILARKPLVGTVAANVAAHGTGALNIDGCRIEGPTGDGVWGTSNAKVNPDRTFVGSPDAATYRTEQHPAGRWPANVALDEEAAAMLDEQSGVSKSSGGANGGKLGARVYGKFANETLGENAGGLGDTGGASRFFYCAKASRAERNAGLDESATIPLRRQSGIGDGIGGAPSVDGERAVPERNNHPTVKPVALMRWLVRLVTPPGGALVLDPFAGSGTTGIACALEGFDFTGIEREAEYVEIARKRIAHAAAQGNLFKATA